MDEEPNSPEQELPPRVVKVLQRFMERGLDSLAIENPRPLLGRFVRRKG